MNHRSLATLTLALLLGALPAHGRGNGARPAYTPGVFDFYVLSLSWSPSYCLSNPRDSQCTGKGYGFVLHGLWPQFADRRWPQFCAPLTPLSAEDTAKGMTLFPSPQLLAHEWKKHGTCSGLGARGYLDAADHALATVAIPTALQPSPSASYLAPAAIRQLFQQSNPGLPADGVAVYCKGQVLSEVRVCLNKQLAPMACGAALSGQCKADRVRVPGVR